MNNEKPVKEPLFHIIKRDGLPKWKMLCIYVGAILIALFVVGSFCAITSKNVSSPFKMLSSIFEGDFSTERRRWNYLQEFMLLLAVSMALLPAFKMKFWNLGANGQIVVSALVTFALMNWGKTTGANNALVVLLMIICGVSAGIIWAIIPAIFKAFFRTNESLFTLMMNYIAEGLVTVMITIWAPTGSGSLSPIDNYAFAEIGNKYLLPIILFAIVTAFMYFYLTKSKHGYELSLVGESENTARYAGVNVKKVFIRTLVLSGAICGLVGLMFAGSVDHLVATNSHKNMGFTAIMTVWLANFNPLMTIVTCALITLISRGMVQVRQDFGFTNDSIANVALGFIYFFIIACFFFTNYKIVFRKRIKKHNDPKAVALEDKESKQGGKV